MSTIWSSADGDLLEKLDRRLQESDIPTLSAVSTNATASDLCGPGRTLGLAFRYLGRKLEIALSRYFEKHGFGPKPTSERILKRSVEIGALRYDNKDAQKIAMKIKRKLHSYLLEQDCRRLLKYLQYVCQAFEKKYIFNKYAGLKYFLISSSQSTVSSTSLSGAHTLAAF